MKETAAERRTGDRISGNERVRIEMQTFLMALASYADHVASDPKVTFEEHLVSLRRAAGGTRPGPLAKAARSNA